MTIELTSIELTLKMHYKNAKGLARVAGLAFEITPEVYEKESDNKGRWNKFMGDMIKKGMDACNEVAEEEYKGIARSEKEPEKTEEIHLTKVEETVEELDRKADDVIKEYIEGVPDK